MKEILVFILLLVPITYFSQLFVSILNLSSEDSFYSFKNKKEFWISLIPFIWVLGVVKMLIEKYQALGIIESHYNSIYNKYE